MADTAKGGEFHGATKVAGMGRTTQQQWQPLLDSIASEGIQLTADATSGKRYVVAGGQQVFILPGVDNNFVSGAIYLKPEDIVARLSTMSSADTKALEKSLGLRPTGAVANNALIQRYLDEANKASVNNMASALAFKSGTIGSFQSSPLNTVAQAQISIKTGDISTGTRASKSISITQFSEGDAQAILEQFYNSTLGRRPNKKEVATFKNLINQQAKKQPSTSTTTYGTDGTATTVSGGAGYSQADAQMAARQMAEADPEASAFLSATRYMDAFMNAIGSQA